LIVPCLVLLEGITFVIKGGAGVGLGGRRRREAGDVACRGEIALQRVASSLAWAPVTPWLVSSQHRSRAIS